MIYTDNNRFTEILQPQFNWGRKYNQDNLFKDEWIQPSIWVRFRKQTNIWSGLLFSRERFGGVYVDGIRRFSGNINTNFSAFLSGGMWTGFGHSLVRDDYPRLGNQTGYEFWGTLKPTSQIQLSLTYSSFRMEELNGREDPDTGDWLEPGSEKDVLNELLIPYSGNDVVMHPVTKLVGNTRYDSEDCTQPLSD